MACVLGVPRLILEDMKELTLALIQSSLPEVHRWPSLPPKVPRNLIFKAALRFWMWNLSGYHVSNSTKSFYMSNKVLTRPLSLNSVALDGQRSSQVIDISIDID